jgi:phage replication O-like protein O
MEEQTKTPQLENGFIRVATGKEENDILMALIKANLNSTEYQIVLFIMRKTWGYGKKEDWISITQFMKYTGKGRTTIIEALNKLVRKNVLVRKSGRGIRSLYRLNKDFNTWNTLVRKTGLVRKTDKSSTENRTSLVRKTVLRTTKNNITKDNNTKENNIYINKFIAMFKNVNPSYELLFKNKTQRAAVERLVKKYGEEWLENLINRLPEIVKMPYAPQITTPYELEAKLGRLKVFLEQEKNKYTRMGVEKV